MTSLMPETIEPATGGSAGGPGGTLPLPKAKYGRKKSRVTWTQAEIVDLVSAFGRGDPGWSSERHSQNEANAKLVALGLVAKAAKPVLTEGFVQDVAAFIDASVYDYEPERTLQIRYAIKRLQELLPKRAPK